MSRFGNSTANPTDKEPIVHGTIEETMREKLRQELQPSHLNIMDTSGGCGSFFGIEITSSKFNGMRMIQQHQLVNKILKDEIAQVHGISLKTAPDEE